MGSISSRMRKGEREIYKGIHTGERNALNGEIVPLLVTARLMKVLSHNGN
jgi:hypothetical protein